MEWSENLRLGWRELGFWYGLSAENRRWMLRGSAAGLGGLARELRDYVRVLARNPGWDHEHLGPTMEFALALRDGPRVTTVDIEGRREDSIGLAEELDFRLATARPGDVLRLHEFYGQNNVAAMVLMVERDDFDPAAADPDAEVGSEGISSES